MIALIANTDDFYARQIHRGLIDYIVASDCAKRGRWRLVVISPELLFDRPFEGLDIQGLVVATTRGEQIQMVMDSGIPAIIVPSIAAGVSSPTIAIDDRAVGEAAANYFLGRNYHHFAYASAIPPEGSDMVEEQRGHGFAAVLHAAGREVSWYGPSARLPAGATLAREDPGTWLGGLPKPVALFAYNDILANRLLSTAVAIGLSVPMQIAILGVDNDGAFHQGSTGLSSMELPFERMGSLAGACLVELIHGIAPDRPVTLLPPSGVITRTSSDAQAVDDADVIDALRYIREHANEGMDVSQILRSIPLTRRTLERRFRRSLGISLKDEIQRVRMERAKYLLAHTRLSIREIATATGFANPNRLLAAFKAETGRSPAAYRDACIKPMPDGHGRRGTSEASDG